MCSFPDLRLDPVQEVSNAQGRETNPLIPQGVWRLVKVLGQVSLYHPLVLYRHPPLPRRQLQEALEHLVRPLVEEQLAQIFVRIEKVACTQTQTTAQDSSFVTSAKHTARSALLPSFCEQTQ